MNGVKDVSTDFARMLMKYVAKDETKVEELKKEIQVLKEELASFEAEKESMFGLEDKTPINNAIFLATQKLTRAQLFMRGYREVLSIDAFRLRLKDGFPAFLLLDVTQPVKIFWLQVNWMKQMTSSPKLPKLVIEQLEDVRLTLGRKVGGTFQPNQVRLSTELKTTMPPDVRTHVKKIQGSSDFSRIFILAEATTWKIDAITPAVTDPLVIGWNEKSQEFYLIAVYNPTTFEKYLREQFAHTFK